MSSRISVERKRFTVAHELAHRIIRSTGNPVIDLERAMNRFAGAFLVPGQCLRDEVGTSRHRITYYEIVRLKHIYGVSATALLMRLRQVGVLSEGSVQRAFATFARSWRRSEPDPIQPDHGFAAFEKPRRFKRLVSRAVGEELMSTAIQNGGISAASRAFSGWVCCLLATGSPDSSSFGSRSHLFGHQSGAGPAASGASRERFTRPNRPRQAAGRGRGTMVRYETYRRRCLAGGGSGPHVGSCRQRVAHPMQLLASTVALQTTRARRIPAVRFAATFATSLLAAGLRTVPVAAVAGPAQDDLTPAQTAIEEPTLKT
ncbi:MAG: ImmA/IrrE family metallo-endopeptidase [Paracoccaceae bacterium]|nr:ImmA/IrrE family metallo-endopeptidase [Paracoccaceae bacterium]